MPMTTNDVEVKHYIDRWRRELSDAAKILKGSHLESFRSMVADIANLVGIVVTDTGTFVKTDSVGDEAASPKQIIPAEHAANFVPKGWKPLG